MGTKLPPHLQDTLDAIMDRMGDDIRFALGHLNHKTASAYVSKLKRRGLAYTARINGVTEVWLTNKGAALAKRD